MKLYERDTVNSDNPISYSFESLFIPLGKSKVIQKNSMLYYYRPGTVKGASEELTLNLPNNPKK